MPLVNLPYPEIVAPENLQDWKRIWPILRGLNRETVHPAQISSGKITQGSLFFIAGEVYLANGDTDITGVQTNYVKITPGESVATAEHVADLTGVSWSDTYNGYYDPSGNLYVFSEQLALSNSEITENKTLRIHEGNGELDSTFKLSGNNSWTGENEVTISGAGTFNTKDLYLIPVPTPYLYIDVYGGAYSDGIAYDFSTGNMIRGDGGADTIQVFNGLSNLLVTEFSTSFNNSGNIAIDPSTGNLIVQKGDTITDRKTIYIMDGISSTILSSFALEGAFVVGPRDFAINPETGNFVICDSDLSSTTNYVYIYSGLSGTRLSTLAISSADTGDISLSGLSFDEHNNLILVDGLHDELVICDGVSSTVIIRIELNATDNPGQLAYDPDGHRVMYRTMANSKQAGVHRCGLMRVAP